MTSLKQKLVAQLRKEYHEDLTVIDESVIYRDIAKKIEMLWLKRHPCRKYENVSADYNSISGVHLLLDPWDDLCAVSNFLIEELADTFGIEPASNDINITSTGIQVNYASTYYKYTWKILLFINFISHSRGACKIIKTEVMRAREEVDITYKTICT